MTFCKISTYDDIGDLIEQECPEYVDSVDSEIMDFLHGVNDFEPLTFMVVNDNLVITYDNISGDVISQEDISEFIEQSVNYAMEEA